MSFYPLRISNQTGETMPGYAVMFAAAISRLGSGQIAFSATKPAIPPNISGHKVVLVNSGKPLASNEAGWARYAEVPGPVLYDSAQTPGFGVMWGPSNGSWKLVRGQGGFEILGENDTTNTLTYARMLHSIKKHGATTSAIDPASDGQTGPDTGTATLWDVETSSGDLTDGLSVTITNRSLDSTIASGTYVIVEWSWEYLEWMIVWADC